MDHFEDDDDEKIFIDTICVGCTLFKPVNDVGLCNECFARLGRDLIRSRDWAYLMTAFALPEDQLEALREQVIQDYGEAYESIEDPHMLVKRKGKNKHAHSRDTRLKRKITAKAIREYDTAAVLQSARDFMREQDNEWVNFSRLSQHLYETFYNLNPKQLGSTDKKYKSLLKFISDYPEVFEVRPEDDKKGVYWIRLTNIP